MKEQGLGIREQGLGIGALGSGKGPVRGTQSFVGVMVEVWRRPALTALEVAWRWVAGGLVLGFAAVLMGRRGVVLGLDVDGLRAMTVFQPVAAAVTLRAAMDVLLGFAWPVLRWFLPCSFVVWLVAAGVGRSLVLRRLEPGMHGRAVTMVALGMIRALVLAGVWVLWGWSVLKAARIAITGPAERGVEPSLVLFCAMVICGTLLLYVLWGIASWFLQLAPVLAMRLDLGTFGSLRAALAAREVRGKLIEINLVMNIVKIALIVLAMVFSASPLPFSNVATEGFLACWWGGVAVLWMVLSDYFHVVRMAAYLRLWSSYNSSAERVAPAVEAAS